MIREKNRYIFADKIIGTLNDFLLSRSMGCGVLTMTKHNYHLLMLCDVYTHTSASEVHLAVTDAPEQRDVVYKRSLSCP